MNTFERVAKWNELCGNTVSEIGTNEYWQALANQFHRIKEELEELAGAIDDKDIEGVFDAGLDLDVVVAGLNMLTGCDYTSGINAVCDNNDLKVTTDKGKAENWQIFNQDNGTECYVEKTEYCDNTFYCVKRTEDNKILKYGNFPKVDLSKFVPEPVEQCIIFVREFDNITEDMEESGFDIMTLNMVQEGEEALRAIMDQNEIDAMVATIKNGDLQSIRSYPLEEE